MPAGMGQRHSDIIATRRNEHDSNDPERPSRRRQHVARPLGQSEASREGRLIIEPANSAALKPSQDYLDLKSTLALATRFGAPKQGEYEGRGSAAGRL